MDIKTFVFRSLTYHRRTNLAVLLGVITGSTALTGALLVGDSMRGSLRAKALERLGPVDHAVVATRFFREALAPELEASVAGSGQGPRVVPVIQVRGAATQAESGARVNRINVLGVDRRFWLLDQAGSASSTGEPPGRSVVLNESLAEQLGAGPGDDVLLRIGRPSTVAVETLLGHRDETTLTLRLTVSGIAPSPGIGSFSISPDQRDPSNAFVPLATLQRAMKREGKANALLVASDPGSERRPDIDLVRKQLDGSLTLADVGLAVDEQDGVVILESEAMLIEPRFEAAALETAAAAGASASRVLTYLANSISLVPDDSAAQPAAMRSIPYSTVSAIEGALPELRTGAADKAVAPTNGQILLSQWAGNDLAATIGKTIRLSYYVSDSHGQLRIKHADFRVAIWIPTTDNTALRALTPEYEGITDTENLSDWNAPFPIDHNAIRDRDEEYWDRHGATPKAFITFADGERLWAQDNARFGRCTSIRLYPHESTQAAGLARQVERGLLEQISAADAGLALTPVREQALAVGQGSTDFGGLFIGFSFFLILSACLLVALLFRLGVERRSRQVGLLLAAGFSRRRVTLIIVAEGAVISLVGSAIGLVAALGYAWAMLAGLRTWWSDAVNAPFLSLHATGSSLVIGFAAGTLVAILSIAWSVRGLARRSPRALLAGVIQSGRAVSGDRRGRRAAIMAILSAVLAAILIVVCATTDAVPATGAFFGSGALMLVACIATVARILHVKPKGRIRRPGVGAQLRLGLRNVSRNHRRSLLTVALIASATFVIAALQAFRLETDGSSLDKHGGAGGFTLFAESVVPLPYDLNTAAGRESLNIGDDAGPSLAGLTAIPFRLRDGDETSCLNLYNPTVPRILGATDVMIERGGFDFAASIAETPEERRNPWLLLRRTCADGVIPVIGDEAAVRWQMHLGLERELVITDEHGRDVRLVFVGLLRGSALQGELIIAESRFTELFPSIGGHGFFLIETPPDRVAEIESVLERELTPFGFDVDRTARRLQSYNAVQNTYLSTFQTLGGLGLILGTLGLAAALLRNVWERRGELALMRALGFSPAALGGIVLVESAVLVLVGLAAGVVPALVAVAPHLAHHANSVPWLRLSATLAGVFVVAMIAGVAAVRPALSGPLITALRSE